MPVLKTESQFGESVPPVNNYAITTNLPGWDAAMALKDGDPAIFAQIQHIYPRFAPWRDARTLIGTLAAKLSIPEGHGGLAFTHPSSFSLARYYAFLKEGKLPEHFLTPEELLFRVVDINSIRLYLVFFPIAKTPGILESWQNPGTGISVRLAEDLLQHLDTMVEIECDKDGKNPPDSQCLPEVEAHDLLRKRVAGYFHRAARDPELVKIADGDVYLYPTGMASIHWAHEILQEYRPGTALILGAVFHNTYHHLLRYAPSMKHFGDVSASGLDAVESYLEGETKAGRPISYAFIEFPSNPLLVSADLHRLHALSRKHNFVLVVDDTIGSFSNVDVLPACDMVVTSLTKSFSGYADVMAGSTALNPLSPHYPPVKKLFAAQFRNELFSLDAQCLYANSESYLPRSTALGHNATSLAQHLHALSLDPTNPIQSVSHPSVHPSLPTYQQFARLPTDDYLPQGPCLLNIDLASLPATRAFYEALAFYPGPHLGAHKTLSLCYNALVFSKPDEVDYHRGYGIRPESVRVSVGLEPWEDLRDTVDVAVEAACRAWEEEKRVEKSEGDMNGNGHAKTGGGDLMN